MGAVSAIFATFALLATSAQCVHLFGRDLNAPLLQSYDYVVVGCGISGLVVANRLSEDSSVQVLCIEAGEPDQGEDVIDIPVYVGADIGGVYDWDLTTVPQTQLDGAIRPMPQGKVLGGGSILNAMCWNRGGQDDFDAWEALGNPGWSWDGLLPYFMKSETYTPVYSEEIADEYSIHYNPAVHGTSGPVNVSYPNFFYPQSANLFAALNYLGVPTAFDPNDGTTAGAAFVPTDLNPDSQTRADARVSYYDPYATRENFHVITGQHVTQVLIDGTTNNEEASDQTNGGNVNGDGSASGGGLGFDPGSSTTPPTGEKRSRDANTANLRITGVEFAADAAAPRQTVYATREVIVAAGALHSAQLLQLSGIGPAALLETYNITVAIDLPGVGNNLQDHCLVGTFYPYNNASFPLPTELTTNATYNLEAEAEYDATRTGPWTAGSPNGLAFPPLSLISNNSWVILDNASMQNPTDYLVPGLDSTVIAGYTAQSASLVQRLAETTVAAYEIINNNAGSLTVSVMHPFSRGTCYINSPDPFDPPLIDPRWLTNPVDRQVLIEALQFNRLILAAPSMLELQAAQFVPPFDADEAALNQVIDNGIRTEFHPSGTCAMLPLEQGGVVDSRLVVWGTQNLRVVDAGIFPLIPAAHLQAVVYGVAEKAADIIKADNVNVQPSIVRNASASLTATASSIRPPYANSTIAAFGASLTSSVVSIHTTLVGEISTSSATAQNRISASASLTATSETSPSTVIIQTETSTASDVDLVSATLSPSVLNASQLSSSIIAALTSGGVLPQVASALESFVVGTVSAPSSLPAATATSGASSSSDTELLQKEEEAINALVKWLLQYFHVA
ncbi:Glucose-methanol-choline oxidoreductase, N-terminal [Lasallia pustulata]|uniref:Glucose-methanol-choline oxidoreductase, N-terminal n=1 Tax=Lasallia pustulata TaxID=136370 RepID=A0A1W5CT22_9LECA|nr:Glucose-methanol-choline oxidoreductase, N-terminal [Lasallia pustulata]